MDDLRRNYSTKAYVFVVIERFLTRETYSGILLFCTVFVAMIWANSPWSDNYFGLWQTELGLRFGQNIIDLNLIHWINDAFMALFFLLIGLEIKREILVGELSSTRLAAFPFVAALGGMILPALLYLVINLQDSGNSRGFGIPMATDIAFVLGFLLILGKKVPIALKVFITSLAVIDDLGAITVIALFYSSSIKLAFLGYATIPLAILIILNVTGIRKLWPYLSMGIALWIMFELSGIHATIAGVLLAMTIPVRSRINPEQFLNICRMELNVFRDKDPGRNNILLTSAQQDALEEVEDAYKAVQNPLVRLEHQLHPISAFIIIPLFALANAGVGVFTSNLQLLTPINSGIICGLVLGKPFGIIGFSYLFDRLGLVKKPGNLSWNNLIGAGILGGVGFTMSIFITHLAFSQSHEISSAKIIILVCSLLMGILGVLTIYRANANRNNAESTR